MMGARVVHSEEEMRRLIGMEPGDSDPIDIPSSGYRSKTLH